MQMNLKTDSAAHAELGLSNNEALALVIVARRWRKYNGLLRNQRLFFGLKGAVQSKLNLMY